MSIPFGLAVPLSAILVGHVLVPRPAGPIAQAAADVAAPILPKSVIHLFDGKDLSGWTPDVPARDADPNGPPSFVVRDGKLVSLGTPGGHLLTNARYRDYRLEVEYRFSAKPGNSGVLVHASTP